MKPQDLIAKYGTNPYTQEDLKPFVQAMTSRLEGDQRIESTPQGYQRAGDLVGKGPIPDMTKRVIPDPQNPGHWIINPVEVGAAQTSQLVPADTSSAMRLMGMSYDPATGDTLSRGTGEQTTPPLPPGAGGASFAPPAISQIESGNRDFLPTGAPVVSPKGAMYGMQVMPSTAAQPGYGVRPVSPDIMALPANDPRRAAEFDRLGADYATAMRNRYGGDPAKAASAYNAGPGRTDRAIGAGGNFLHNMPAETQNYANRFSKPPAGTVDGKPYWMINGVPYDNPEGR
jgi:hypothetical protein